MAVPQNSTVDRTDLQPLTLSELERHIERAAVEIARGAEPPSLAYDGDEIMPRRISAAELVRRMSRFMVFN